MSAFSNGNRDQFSSEWVSGSATKKIKRRSLVEGGVDFNAEEEEVPKWEPKEIDLNDVHNA